MAANPVLKSEVFISQIHVDWGFLLIFRLQIDVELK